MSTYIYYGDTLYHHGIKGQKWGLRKYQNEDGSLTAAGREHYGYGVEEARASLRNARKSNDKAFYKALGSTMSLKNVTKSGRAETKKAWNKYNKEDTNWRAAKANVKAAKQQAKEDKRAERIAKDQAKFDQMEKEIAKARNGKTKSDVVKAQYVNAGKNIIGGTALKAVSTVAGGILTATGHKKVASLIGQVGHIVGTGMQLGGAVTAVGTTSYALNKKRK